SSGWTARNMRKRRTTWSIRAASAGCSEPATAVHDRPPMEQNARMGSFVPSPSLEVRVPDLVPVLSRGKHRHPRQGACFMELASFVAGERWSDHPACTHPLLASLARLVNDATSDA